MKIDKGDAVLGCPSCGMITRVNIVCIPEDVSPEPNCPNCTNKALILGPLPYVVARDTGYYLSDGTAIQGPYDSRLDAQQWGLWDWFGVDTNAKKKERRGPARGIDWDKPVFFMPGEEV